MNTRLTVVGSFLCASLLAGCGVAGVDAVNPGSALQGKLMGGQQPVVGATISLYAAGAGGTGLGAASLLRLPVVSVVGGSFSISGDYTCPSATSQVYLVATGGNPGLGVNNPALVMMTALGDCQNLPGTAFVTINEVTTAAAVWSLAQFMTPATGTGVGASATNATGLRNAFLSAANLVNTTTGYAPGAALPAGAVIERSKLYTLADVLAVCINSDGGAGCAPLFSAATVAGKAPTDTVAAAMAIVQHPASNVAGVFNANTANGPFQPTLTAAPNDWTMSLTYVGGGLNYPTAVGVDSGGNVWSANYFGPGVSKLLPNGAPAAGSGYGYNGNAESYGLTIDPQDNVWITDEESDPANNYNGSLVKFSNTGTLLSGSGIFAGGVYYPYAVAADSNSNIWVADYGHSAASLLANDGTSLSGNGYQSAQLPLPVAVALDGAHNAWFGAQGSAVKVTPAGVISQYSCCRSPSGIAVDQNSNVWITDYAGTALVEVSATGAMLQKLTGVGGIAYPESLAVDGAGNIWVANYRGNTISGFGTASGGTASAVLSPGTGFGVGAGLQEPFGIAVDASGSVWVSNFASASLTQFVGLGAPRKTPLAGLPVAP